MTEETFLTMITSLKTAQLSLIKTIEEQLRPVLEGDITMYNGIKVRLEQNCVNSPLLSTGRMNLKL